MHKPEKDRPVLRVIEPTYEIETVDVFPNLPAPALSHPPPATIVGRALAAVRRVFRRVFCLDAYWECHTPESSSWGSLHIEAGTGDPDEKA